MGGVPPAPQFSHAERLEAAIDWAAARSYELPTSWNASVLSSRAWKYGSSVRV